MSEAVARAVGSESHVGIEIDGVVCIPRALTVAELGEVERACVDQYVRGVLKTFHNNADLLPPEVAEKVILEKMDEMSTWDVQKLPKKSACDPSSLKLTSKLQGWVETEYKGSFKKTKDAAYNDRVMRQLVATSIDNGALGVDEYKNLTNSDPKMVQVGYVNWWITGTFAGMTELVWAVFKHSGVKKDALFNEFSKNPALAAAVSREMERLTAPTLGN